MSDTDPYYVGDEWFIEAEVENTKTGKPGEPGEVTGVVFPPGFFATPTPTREPIDVTFTKTEVEEGKPKWEAGPVELDEPGIWREVTSSTAPSKGVEPNLITVFATSSF